MKNRYSNGYTKVHHSSEYTHTRIRTHFYIDSARRHTRNPQPQTNERKNASVQFVGSFVYVWHHETTSSYISWQFFVADLPSRISFFFHFIFIKIYINKCRSLLDSFLRDRFFFVQMQCTAENRDGKITFCNPFDNFSQRKNERKYIVIPFDAVQKLNSSP